MVTILFKFGHRISIIIHDIIIENSISISFINFSHCFQSSSTQQWPAEGKHAGSKQDYNSIVLDLLREPHLHQVYKLPEFYLPLNLYFYYV